MECAIGGRQVYSWVRYDANGRIAERIDLPIVEGRPTVPAAVQDRFFVESSGEVKELGPPDLLLVGDGSGKFTRASWTDGRFVPGGNDIVLRAIPEPQTWVTLIGSIGALIRLQRFRRRT